VKVFKHIINYTIWSLVALYVIVIIAIQIPFIQNQIGTAVAGILSDKLGSRVTIGRVDLGLLNRLIIDDVVIYDQQDSAMLRSRRLSVKVDVLPLLKGEVNISSAQIFGTHLYLYRANAGEQANFQFVIDALTSKEKKEPSKLNLCLGSLIVRDLSADYNQLDAPATPGRFNPRHLTISNASAHVSLRKLTNDSIDLNVRRFALTEHSGLTIKQLTLKLMANRQMAKLDELKIQMPESSLTVDSVCASLTRESDLSTACFRTSMIHASIALDDLAPLLPEALPTGHTLVADLAVGGTKDSITWRSTTIKTSDERLTLTSSGTLQRDGTSSISISQMSMESSLLTEMGDIMPTQARNIVQRLGTIGMKADVELTADDIISSRGTAHTGIGSMAWEGHTDKELSHWNVSLNTDSLNLGLLLEQPALGGVAATMNLTGNGQTLGAEGNIGHITLNGYDYSDITLNGTYGAKRVNATVNISDPSLRAAVEGEADFSEHVKRIKMAGTIENFIPKAINLSERWGDATFSASMNADFTASSASDMQGTIDLADFVMTQGDTTLFHLRNLNVSAGYGDNARHYYNVVSDFGRMHLLGNVSIGDLPQSLAAIVPIGTKRKRADSNDFTLTAHLTDSRWVQKLLGIDLKLDGPLKLDATIDDAADRVSIDAEAPSFGFASAAIRDATLTLRNIADSTTCSVSFVQLSAKGNPLNVALQASTQHDGSLASALTLTTDHADGGTIHTVTTIYDNDNGIREAHIRLLPSALKMRGATWDVLPCDIVYSDKRLLVDHFTVQHDDQFLTVDGIASTQQRDTLTALFQGMDIAYVLGMTNFKAVRFGGLANGKAVICKPFSDFSAQGDIAVERFLFQDSPMGALEARVEWKPTDKQLDLEAFIDNGPDSLTFVNGSVSPAKGEIDIDIMARGTNIAFVHSFTKNFMKELSGQAYGDVHIGNSLKDINVTGDVAVNGRASFAPLGTTYTFSEDTVHLAVGAIGFSNFILHDREGHEGVLNGAVKHRNFKNITFDLTADASNLLVYDLPLDENVGSTGGTVWANGHADMRGRPGEVVIDCDVVPAPSSVFIYNAANPDAINRQQFVTWGENDTETTAATSQKTTTAAGASTASTRGDLRLNLRINATTDATLRLLMDQHSGDVISLQGQGALRASYYNKGPFTLFGTYSIEDGVYSMTIQNILKKNFTFQPGSSLVFSGDPLQAALNLKAQHTVNGVPLSDLGLGSSFTSNTIRVNCLMNILGTAGQPTVEFDLEMPTLNSEEQQMIRSIMASEQEINQQVVYLLGIGRFYTQGANNATSQSYGQTELAMQSLLSGTVSTQINQLLSQVVKNDDWNFGANISTGSEGWHNAEYEGMVSGRMLTGRLLINGQFGYRDNATQATSSFIGDFDIRYLLTPSGSLALKAYNQTNNRYFTHSSLNTQGIGVIMKKDFNGLRDLFNLRRKSTKGQKDKLTK
jgi:hypothetical protein